MAAAGGPGQVGDHRERGNGSGANGRSGCWTSLSRASTSTKDDHEAAAMLTSAGVAAPQGSAVPASRLVSDEFTVIERSTQRHDRSRQECHVHHPADDHHCRPGRPGRLLYEIVRRRGDLPGTGGRPRAALQWYCPASASRSPKALEYSVGRLRSRWSARSRSRLSTFGRPASRTSQPGCRKVPRAMAPASSRACAAAGARSANRGRAAQLAGETVSPCRHRRSQSSSHALGASSRSTKWRSTGTRAVSP